MFSFLAESLCERTQLKSKNILIVGASSEIAMACARYWLHLEEGGVRFTLVGRSPVKLRHCADDLMARGADSVDIATLDFEDIGEYVAVFRRICAEMGRIDIALIAHGSLPVQGECEGDVELTAAEFFINATSVICCLTALGKLMENCSASGSSIAVITSVAGDRGRESNYLYGSAKAAISTFCDGLRIRLAHKNISVTDIRPGMVDTVMTRDLDLPAPLLATPEQVARVIVRAIRAKSSVVYAPRYWSLLMLVIRSIPEFIFGRLRL